MAKIPTGIIFDVVEVLEEVLAETRRTLTPSNKAELVVLLCEEIKDQEKRESKKAGKTAVKTTVTDVLNKR